MNENPDWKLSCQSLPSNRLCPFLIYKWNGVEQQTFFAPPSSLHLDSSRLSSYWNKSSFLDLENARVQSIHIFLSLVFHAEFSTPIPHRRSRVCFTFPPFMPLLLPSSLFISFAYIGFSSLWSDGSVVRCPGYNPVRTEPGTGLQGSPKGRGQWRSNDSLNRTWPFFLFPTNSRIFDSLNRSRWDCTFRENSLDFSCVHASGRCTVRSHAGIIQTPRRSNKFNERSVHRREEASNGVFVGTIVGLNSQGRVRRNNIFKKMKKMYANFLRSIGSHSRYRWIATCSGDFYYSPYISSLFKRSLYASVYYTRLYSHGKYCVRMRDAFASFFVENEISFPLTEFCADFQAWFIIPFAYMHTR